MHDFFESGMIIPRYEEVMKQERQLNKRGVWKSFTFEQKTDDTTDYYEAVWRIFEVIKSSLVPRSYLLRYNLYSGKRAYESVGAHANTVAAIMSNALDYCYGCDFGDRSGDKLYTVDGYSYRDIMEAIRLHDLAENEIGDIPDNGDRDDEEKNQQEMRYFEKYMATYPEKSNIFKNSVLRLMRDFQYQSSPTGALLYLADKTAALFVTLCLDFIGQPPLMAKDSPYASSRDIQEMELCDYCVEDKFYKASEMWAIDYFKMRSIIKFDETTFYTRLIVMATLMVNGKWYTWREKDYI